MSEEQFDILTSAGAPTGETKPRGEVHRDGDWHRSFHLWIVKNGTHVLLQRRSVSKDLEPGKVDVSVGGHYSAGETLAEVVREVEEELGLFVRPDDLHFLETRQVERRYENAVDREFQDIYALKNDQPLDHYYLTCNEVSVLYEIAIDKAIELYRDGGFAPVSGFDCQGRVNNALLVEEDLIEQARKDTLGVLGLIQEWLNTKP